MPRRPPEERRTVHFKVYVMRPRRPNDELDGYIVCDQGALRRGRESAQSVPFNSPGELAHKIAVAARRWFREHPDE